RHRARARRSRRWGRRASELESTDFFAVLGLIHDGKAHALEELLRAVLAGLPDDGEPGEAALACLVGRRLDHEFTDALSLGFCRDIHAPDTAAELFFVGIRIEVG